MTRIMLRVKCRDIITILPLGQRSSGPCRIQPKLYALYCLSFVAVYTVPAAECWDHFHGKMGDSSLGLKMFMTPCSTSQRSIA